MSRSQSRLSARTVQTKVESGYFADGAGLYLQVSRSASEFDQKVGACDVARSWIFRFKIDKRPREMGLGSTRVVSLVEARRRAAMCRQLLAEGKDPIVERLTNRQQVQVRAQAAMSFDECARAYIASHRDGWRNAKHAAQWESTLRLYAIPVIGSLPIAEVLLPHVLKILEPIWRTRTETASRLRGRIESIIGWATVRGLRTGDNPARWRGHLDHLLPMPKKVAAVEHYAALPFTDIAAFVARLREQDGMGARALEFLILTAARSGEVRGASWSEIDLKERVWTVPAIRMKSARDHRVPLSDAAIAVLKRVDAQGSQALAFAAPRGGVLSDMTLSAVMRRMKVDAVPHGFRSTLRDWCAECTEFPSEVAEMALAHAVGDKVEAAYRRGDLFEKRRSIMAMWARHCETIL
jgi:integrase